MRPTSRVVGPQHLVASSSSRPGVGKAYRALLREMREERRAGAVKPTSDQEKVEPMFPAIARYVRGYGYVAIGDQEGFAEALTVLELGLARWFEERGEIID